MSCVALLGWLAAANLLGYAAAWTDKRRAGRAGQGRSAAAGSRSGRNRHRAGLRRIPERRFLLVALLGGGPGTGAVFLLHRHKTRKRRFMLPFWAMTGVGAGIAGAAAAILC